VLHLLVFVSLDPLDETLDLVLMLLPLRCFFFHKFDLQLWLQLINFFHLLLDNQLPDSFSCHIIFNL